MSSAVSRKQSLDQRERSRSPEQYSIAGHPLCRPRPTWLLSQLASKSKSKRISYTSVLDGDHPCCLASSPKAPAGLHRRETESEKTRQRQDRDNARGCGEWKLREHASSARRLWAHGASLSVHSQASWVFREKRLLSSSFSFSFLEAGFSLPPVGNPNSLAPLRGLVLRTQLLYSITRNRAESPVLVYPDARQGIFSMQLDSSGNILRSRLYESEQGASKGKRGRLKHPDLLLLLSMLLLQ